MESSAGQPPRPTITRTEFNRRAVIVGLNSMLTLVDLGLAYGAFSQANYGALAVTALGLVSGIYNINRQYKPLELSNVVENLPDKTPAPPITPQKDVAGASTKDTLGKNIKGRDPKRDEGPRDRFGG